MNEPGTSKEDATNLCKICNENLRRYTCPKCGINYCSINCYKSEGHQDCSESFYKDWVELEMKVQDYDPENKKKMIEILERLKLEEEEPSILEDILNDKDEEDPEELDSDDEQEGPSLQERIANIDLDNADELWSILTDAERQEFGAIIENYEVDDILPQWTPWWEQIVEKRLVREVDEIPQYQKLCPSLVILPEISGQLKASPCVEYNLMNVIYSYAYTALHFFGDHLNSAKQAAQVFLYVCDNMNEKKVYNDVDAAFNAVFKRIFGGTDLMESEEDRRILSIKQAGDQILCGPEDSNCTYYVKAVLSDLHRLFSKARTELNSKSEPAKTQFPKKFQEHKNLNRVDLSKKSIYLHLKKLEFYLSWTNRYGQNFCGKKLYSQESNMESI